MASATQPIGWVRVAKLTPPSPVFSPLNCPKKFAPTDRRPWQRNRAAASTGTSKPKSPACDSANAEPAPTFPASAGPIPRSPTQPHAPTPKTSKTQAPPEAQAPPRRSPAIPHSTKRQRNRAAASIGTSTPKSPRAIARMPSLSQRSLRAQDRFRGAQPNPTHRPQRPPKPKITPRSPSTLQDTQTSALPSSFSRRMRCFFTTSTCLVSSKSALRISP